MDGPLCDDRDCWLAHLSGFALQIWFGQMALNFLWSPVVFRFHNLALGLAIITTMLALILSFIALQWRRNRTTAILFVPYALWVAFASLLNYSLYHLN